MALYLVGLGTDSHSISVEAQEAIKECSAIYLEGYTVNFPYPLDSLDFLGNIEVLKREDVEDERIVQRAKKENVALLVYGNPLIATTHMQLIYSCIEKNIKYRIFHNASIFDSVAETGLEGYKFGKTCSIPDWKEHKTKPTSFAEYIKENLSIGAHTLVLVDIGLSLPEALEELEIACSERNVLLPEQIIVLSKAGTKSQKIFYGKRKDFSQKIVDMPFCVVVPATLNSFEEKFLLAVSRQI